MFVDTHAHLTDEKFNEASLVIKKASNELVNKIIVPTTSIKDLDKAMELSDRFEEVYVLAGVHPEEIDSVEDIKKMTEELRERIKKSKKIVGIGEIGLDFYFDKEKDTKKRQIEIFRAQMELASELDLPVAIHMRDSQTETLEVLEQLEKIPKGQFHCFAGDQEFLKMVLHWDFFVSFAGNVTYKSAKNLRDRLKEVRLNRLLLETDSPYLSPEPIRGTINEPANVKIIAKFIAQELNLTIAQISEITQKNTLCLYSLDT